MAKQTVTQQNAPEVEPKRKGVHAKRGTSKLSTSKNYKKPYRGQGR